MILVLLGFDDISENKDCKANLINQKVLDHLLWSKKLSKGRKESTKCMEKIFNFKFGVFLRSSHCFDHISFIRYQNEVIHASLERYLGYLQIIWSLRLPIHPSEGLHKLISAGMSINGLLHNTWYLGHIFFMQNWIGLIQFGLQNDLIVFEEIKAQVHFINGPKCFSKINGPKCFSKIITILL